MTTLPAGLAALVGSAATTDDTLAVALPLFRQVADLHAVGRVAPLEGVAALHVDEGRLYFEADKASEPRRADARVRALEDRAASTFQVVGHRIQTTDADMGEEEQVDLLVATGDVLERPQFVTGYRSWEHTLGHHDALTDIHVLGQVLASLACGLDFTRREHVEAFAAHRTNLFAIAPGLNPVVARHIVHLTELDRRRRAQDLASIIGSLAGYRDQVVDLDVDLRRIEGFRNKDLAGRREIVLARLRERLFEISRRNRLLYFKPTLQTLNLTFASVPILFDPSRIRPEQLFTWQPAVESLLVSQAAIPLNRYLRFEDAPYVPSVLDRLISDARRDTAEFGFSQLRLVIAFLRWHNLKDAPEERIDSPLLLLPVELSRKKGVRDSYVMRATTRDAEVNPALRYHLKQLYGIDLPHAIDLTETTLAAFHDTLMRQIQASEPGVVLSRLDRPQVDVVYDRARRRLDQYRRRMRTGDVGSVSFHDLEYSYRRDDYQPLGLRLFVSLVRPSPAPLGDMFRSGAVRQPYMSASGGKAEEKERLVFAVHEGGDAANRYAWDFDLCSLTLGNFNYRRMSLVRDFDLLLASAQPSGPFDATFSLAPRPVDPVPERPVLDDRFPVVPCDPTQLQAVALAHRGRSYIIQGPPGTGKSQTITNLIADLLAHGKRILFVCEKRAAIDVVYHRLQQRGLHDLVCLIYDSQADKRDFILDLKATYERLLREDGDPAAVERRRSATLAALARAERPIAEFEEAMAGAPELAGVPVRALLGRLAELGAHTAALSPEGADDPPPYREWLDHSDSLARLDAAVREVRADGIYAAHALSRLSPRVAALPRPRSEVQAALQAARAGIEEVGRVARRAGTPVESLALGALAGQVRLALLTRGLVERGQLGLLDPDSGIAARLRAAVTEATGLRSALEGATAANVHWRRKLAPGDTATALEQARAFGSSPLRFLSPAYWSLRRVLRERYDFSKHAVRPSLVQVLERLQAELAAAEAVQAAAGAREAEFRTEQPVEALAAEVEVLRTQLGPMARDEARVMGLLELAPVVADLASQASILFDDADGWTLPRLDAECARMEAALPELPDWLPCLELMAEVPERLAALIRTEKLTLPGIEAAVARRTAEDIWRRNRAAARFDGRALEWHAAELARRYDEWLKVNAEAVIARTTGVFRGHVARAALPSVRLSAKDAEFKRRYNAGRRELEHEFGKTMRYKSVRGLLAGAAGEVILDLKPVWLMSPLSVSDTLPIEPGAFDAVIFDEASQIPLEEAVPALFRAEQVIISGDQMQLPPTNFFSATRGTEESLLLDDEADGGPAVEYALDSNSFLSHAARNLSSTLLGWHYRSRSEALISFSNAAFYDRQLLTVPDRDLPPAGRKAIRVGAPEEGTANVAAVLDRPVGFHFVENARYESRGNKAEAAYIAELVRGLLAAPERLTIAIVAFSEAQQAQVEEALARLAVKDAEFRGRLEEEQEREEDGQFVGLLVKNLENIQGDERDVVIMSICYGPGPDGRILMNFGPINQGGGEKRLNVAFSRARRHMVVVSSMSYSDIRNVYNDGANALRHYLQYAAAMSEGDGRTAAAVLDALSGRHDHEDGKAPDAVARALRAALEGEGLLVDDDVGQSHFRCDLAVRRAGDTSHRVAVFLEAGDADRAAGILEREALRPALLRQFGWAVCRVLVKDWLEDPAGVVGRIVGRLDGETPPAAVEPPIPDPSVPPAPEPADAAPPVALAPPPPSAAKPGDAPRFFEMIAGTSRKFWHVATDDVEMIVSFGRIGTAGQVKRKAYATADMARAAARQAIREKLARGYRETAGPPSAEDAERA